MDSDTFDNEEEKFYRAVIPSDMRIRGDGSLTSAAFKVAGCYNGCSVERGSRRTDDEAVSFMRRHLDGRIYSILVRDCKLKNIHMKYSPLEDNPFHTELFKSSNLEKMSDSQCKYLARHAVLVSGYQGEQ